MKDFWVALQFLTRIKLKNQQAMDENSFARSVKLFPMVGAVVGLIMLLVYLFLMNIHCPGYLMAALLIVAEFMLVGMLLYDGYMDTADGVFSGRGRERMLEIMKDSRVGANGVIAFVLLMFLKFSAYMELPTVYLAFALLTAPALIYGLIAYNIRYYPYARPAGIGGMFADPNEEKRPVILMTICWFLLMVYLGEFFDIYVSKNEIAVPVLLTILYNRAAAKFLVRRLGGLTGDTYGFLAQTGTLVFLISLALSVGCKVSFIG